MAPSDSKENAAVDERSQEADFKPKIRYGDAGFVNGETILESIGPDQALVVREVSKTFRKRLGLRTRLILQSLLVPSRNNLWCYPFKKTQTCRSR